MSGSVSGSQFNQFVPRHAQMPDVEDPKAWSGPAGREFSGPRSVAPIAKGAFSSQDQALAFRHQGDNTLSHGAKNIGSWLYKSE
jgi:hypothetical protein